MEADESKYRLITSIDRKIIAMYIYKEVEERHVKITINSKLVSEADRFLDISIVT